MQIKEFNFKEIRFYLNYNFIKNGISTKQDRFTLYQKIFFKKRQLVEKEYIMFWNLHCLLEHVAISSFAHCYY